jgi:rSAM/selenodomain-associated transferase 1
VELAILAVFAKAPIPGRVKTRLIPPLTPESAASLHEAMVRDTVNAGSGFQAAVCELHTDIVTDAWKDLDVSRKLQIPGDLGLKMLHALDTGLRAGASRAIILGADAPTVPSGHIETLIASAADVALGPADDGGYYAISARRVHPNMFRGVDWGTHTALSATLRAVAQCSLSVEVGPAWYDVDQPADLVRLAADHNLRSATRNWLARNGFSPAAQSSA